MGLGGPWGSLGDGPMGPWGVVPQPFRMASHSEWMPFRLQRVSSRSRPDVSGSKRHRQLFFESEATTTKCKDKIKHIPGVVQPRFRKNGVTTELPQPVTRFRINGFARSVFSLKRSYYGVTPTRDSSLNKWVCPQPVFADTELLRSYSHP